MLGIERIRGAQRPRPVAAAQVPARHRERPLMQTLAELQELAELAASYSAAYERSCAVSPFDADARAIEDALSLAAIVAAGRIASGDDACRLHQA